MIGNFDHAWRRLSVRHLVALQTVADTGSFRDAAQMLGYSQSAVSDQIAVLEQIVGDRLVDRPGGGRRLALTPAGRTVIAHAGTLAASLTALRADLAAQRSQQAIFRLGIFQSAAARLLPEILRSLSRSRPDLIVRLVEEADDLPLQQLVENGDLDASFGVLPLDPGPLSTEQIVEDEYRLLVPATSPLAARGVVSRTELSELSLVDYRSLRSVHHTLTKLDLETLPNVVLRSDDNATIHALVAAGIAVAVLPELSIHPYDPAVVALPITPSLDPRRLVLMRHRDRHPPDGLNELIDAARLAAGGARLEESAPARRVRSRRRSPGP